MLVSAYVWEVDCGSVFKRIVWLLRAGREQFHIRTNHIPSYGFLSVLGSLSVVTQPASTRRPCRVSASPDHPGRPLLCTYKTLRKPITLHESIRPIWIASLRPGGAAEPLYRFDVSETPVPVNEKLMDRINNYFVLQTWYFRCSRVAWKERQK